MESVPKIKTPEKYGGINIEISSEDYEGLLNYGECHPFVDSDLEVEQNGIVAIYCGPQTCWGLVTEVIGREPEDEVPRGKKQLVVKKMGE